MVAKSAGCADEMHDELRLRVKTAIDKMLAEGERVTFYALADRAGIARSTLYRRDDLRTLIFEARSSGESTDLSERLSRLESDNTQLRRHVAQLEDELAYQRGLSAHRLLGWRKPITVYAAVSFDI